MVARWLWTPLRSRLTKGLQFKGESMLEDAIESMPSWLKGGIAIGVGTMVGVLTAKIVMAIGI